VSGLRKLIVNADDFGLTAGVNRGIVRAFQSGIVTSCTIIASGDAFGHAVDSARENPGLAVGCHLTLVGGRAVADTRHIGSLVDRSGSLPSTLQQVLLKLVSGNLGREQIEIEFRAQIQAIVEAGIKPTHLDTHKHLHAYPRVFEALTKVAHEFSIWRVRSPFEPPHLEAPRGAKARRRPVEFRRRQAGALAMRMMLPAFRRRIRAEELRAPDFCYGVSLTGMLDGSAVGAIIERLEPGVTELICHPGIYDEQLERTATRLKREREMELRALTDPGILRAIRDNQVELISYRDI